MENIFQIIQRPVVTERATNLRESANQYVFRVALAATKGDIKSAIEKLFKVKVVNINTMHVRGKFRRMGNAPGARRSDWKKAIVTLQKGQEIRALEDGQ